MNKCLTTWPLKGSLIPDFMRNFSLFNEEDELLPSKTSNISLSEDEEKVYVEAALPGVPMDGIEITLDKGVLWVRGERKNEETKRKHYYQATSSFSYRIVLPGDIDEGSEPEAGYTNGVLSVTFLKHKKEMPKKISIKLK